MLPTLVHCHPPSAIVQLHFCLSLHSSKHQPGAFPQCCCKSCHLLYLLTQISRAKGWRRKGWWGSWLQWSLSPYRLHLQEPLLSFWYLLPSCSHQRNTPHPCRSALGSAPCSLPSSDLLFIQPEAFPLGYIPLLIRGNNPQHLGTESCLHTSLQTCIWAWSWISPGAVLWRVQKTWVTLPSVCPQTFSGPVGLLESSYPEPPGSGSLPWLHTPVPRAEECWMETCGFSESW